MAILARIKKEQAEEAKKAKKLEVAADSQAADKEAAAARVQQVCPPSTLNPHPPTPNPQPSTLHVQHVCQPQPSTLNLNPQPSTLNPQPSTPNPQPSALHVQQVCQPETRKPKL